MKLINILTESMMNGDAFKSFSDAVIANAPSNVKEEESPELYLSTNSNLSTTEIKKQLKDVENKIKKLSSNSGVIIPNFDKFNFNL